MPSRANSIRLEDDPLATALGMSPPHSPRRATSPSGSPTRTSLHPSPRRTPLGTPTRRSLPVRNLPSLPHLEISDVKLQQPPRWTQDYVLDADGIRDDFYSTIVAASTDIEETIAVALGGHARLWTNQRGSSRVYLPHGGNITCIAFSTSSTKLAIGFSDGSVYIYNIGLQLVTSRLPRLGGAPKPYPSCCRWLSEDSLLVGDSVGHLRMVVLDKTQMRHTLQESWSDGSVHPDLICALSIDPEGKTVACGANDNSVSLWRVEYNRLKFFTRLAHPSAIKAMCFCPWIPNLLVTGAGRHDRKLRIWDTNSGTLIQEVKTPAQITAVFWVGKWEVFVGLGHSRLRRREKDDPTLPFSGLAQIYRLPEGTIVSTIPGEGRCMSAVCLPCGFCIATNRSNLCFYKWQEESRTVPADLIATVRALGISESIR